MEQRNLHRRLSNLLWFMIGLAGSTNAQPPRISDHNQIYWLPITAGIHIKGPWALHLEYQWRRDAWGIAPQQSLLRTGITYKVNKNLSAQAGYGLIHTYVYGDYPIASMGTFPENRIYQQLQWQAQYPKGTETIQRLRLEQRWLKPNPAGSWTYLNRLRYYTRVNHPIGKDKEKPFYLIEWDEIFIGFGRNVNRNVFDQNRAFAGLGRQLSPHWKVEIGAFSQILQQPRPEGNSAVFQYNAGPWLGTILNF